MRVRCTAGVHTHTDDTTVRDCRSHTEPKFTHSGEQLRAQRRRCSLQVSLSSANLGASSGRRSGQRVRKRPAGSAGLSLALRGLPPAAAPLVTYMLISSRQQRTLGHCTAKIVVLSAGGTADTAVYTVADTTQPRTALLSSVTRPLFSEFSERGGVEGTALALSHIPCLTPNASAPCLTADIPHCPSHVPLPPTRL